MMLVRKGRVAFSMRTGCPSPLRVSRCFISPVGINTDAEPSAADVGRIIKQIRREQIPAVFIESFSDPRLLERIRLESGAQIGGTLYSDSLSKADGPAPTYLDMMRHNARTLSSALTH